MSEGKVRMLSLAVVCYLFFGGAGAGACFVASALSFGVPRDAVDRGFLPVYRSFFAPVFKVAIAFLFAGAAFLLADIGRIDRILLLLTSPSVSYITVGAFALVVSFCCTVLCALYWDGLFARTSCALAKVLAAASLVSSMVVMLYSGMLIGSLGAVPFWNSPFIPALFVLSSLSCGCAIFLGSAIFKGTWASFLRVLRRIVAIDVIFMLMEAICVAALVVSTLRHMPAGATVALLDDPGFLAAWLADFARGQDVGSSALGLESSLNDTDRAVLASAMSLVGGNRSWLFWLGFVTVGLIVPLAIDLVVFRRSSLVSNAASAAGIVSAGCVLVGGFFLRYCLVAAGAHPML